MSELTLYEDKIRAYKNRIEDELSSLLEDAIKRDGEVAQLASSIVLAGGKRTRCLVTWIAYELAGGKDVDSLIPLAFAFELIHTATLIHDDIHDSAKYRRGIQTLHEKHGLAKAIIAGDWLFVQGFEMGGWYGKDIVDIVARCCSGIASAELKQLSHISDLSTTPQDYEEVVKGKTAGPFSAGCRVAGILAGCSPEQVEALTNFGMQLGISFQLVDDILDLLGDTRMRKPRGADVIEGKMTLPLIHGLTMLHGDARQRLSEVINGFNDSLWEELIDLLNQAGSLEYSKALVRTHMERGLEELSNFMDCEAKQLLIDLATELIDRNL